MKKMKIRKVLLSLVAVFAAVSLAGQDCPKDGEGMGCGKCQDEKGEKKARKECALKFPLLDVKAKCCVDAVKKELEKIDGVKSVTIEDGVVTLVGTKKLAFSALKKALDAANKAMGSAMNLNYRVDLEKIPAEYIEFVIRDRKESAPKIAEGLKNDLMKLSSVQITDVKSKTLKDEAVIYVSYDPKVNEVSASRLLKIAKELKFEYADVYLIAECCVKCGNRDECKGECSEEEKETEPSKDEEKKDGC